MAETYFFDPKADVFDPIAALLERVTGLKSYFLESSRNHAASRWDWTPTTGGPAQGPQMPGRHPVRPLETIDFRCDIACRGKTHADAWRMVQQLLSASREVKAAAGRLESWRVEESSDQAATLKNVVTVTMAWAQPLLEQPLTVATQAVEITAAQLDTSGTDYDTDDGTLIAPLG